MSHPQKIILRLLEEHHISANELAKRANIPAPSLYHILSGRSSQPRRQTLVKIAEAFGKDISLFESDISPDPSRLTLMAEIYRYVNEIIDTEKLQVSQEERNHIIQQTYHYSLEKQLPNFDKNFAKMMLSIYK